MICRAAVLVSRQQAVPHRDVDDLEDGRNYCGVVAALAVAVTDSANMLRGLLPLDVSLNRIRRRASAPSPCFSKLVSAPCGHRNHEDACQLLSHQVSFNTADLAWGRSASCSLAKIKLLKLPLSSTSAPSRKEARKIS